MSGTIRIEKLGTPGIFLVAKGFEHDAQSAAIDGGMPTLRSVMIPGYVWGEPVEKKRPHAEASIENMINALTRPLTPEESKPKPLLKEALPPVKITAATYELAVEEFNRVFLENRWGDGLPLVPPTPDRVKWMLTGTSRSPNEVIGKVVVKNGIATIEKIAINAVMAGAKPEYLPVIIAAMEGLTDKNYDLLHVQASMGDFTLVILVTGPIAKEINMNYEIGFLGEGWRSNATIGRAVRLSLTNLGHMWPGVNAMARMGRQAAYTFYTFTENQDFSPWPPYHVIQGFKPEDSCVTVSTVGSYYGYGLSMIGSFQGETGELALRDIVKTILSSRDAVFAQYKPEVLNPGAIPNKYVLLIPPELASGLKRLGFTRESLQDYIYDKTSVPYEELSPEEIKGIQAKIKLSIAGEGSPSQRIPPGRIPVFQEALKPGGKVPVLITLEDIQLVVVGYPTGGSLFALAYHRAPYKWGAHETKLIRGATLTKAGR